MALFFMVLAWLAGIAAQPILDLSGGQTLVLAGLALAAAVAFRRYPVPRLVFVLSFTIMAAGWRVAWSSPHSAIPRVETYNDFARPVTLTGVVVAPPDVRDSYVGLRLKVESVRLQDGAPQAVQGQVLVRAETSQAWTYGDRISATGFLVTPPEDEAFSYRDYLAHQGIFGLLSSWATQRLARHQANPALDLIYQLRNRFHRTILRIFPEPESALLSGILLGIESGISPEVRQSFNTTGTTHIIAISGFNITIIAGLFLLFFGKWLGRRRGIPAAAVGILIYTIMAGADAAVVRAAIMGGVSLLALRLGRRTDGLASLAAAAFLMTAVQPQVLYDVGFQLSFAATVGMILYAEPLQHAFAGWLARRFSLENARAGAIAGPVGEYLLFTLAAQATTLPITLFHFQRLSLASVLANPAILPAQPAVMILGGLATLVGSVWLTAGRVLAALAWPFAAYTIHVVDWLAQWPAASVSTSAGGLWGPAGYYVFLAVGTVVAGKRPGLTGILRRSFSLGIVLAALGIGTVVVWSTALRRPDGGLHLVEIDTHGGQAVMITTPSGRNLLVNGGTSPIALQESLGRRLPPFSRRLDWVIITRQQDADVTGLNGVGDHVEVGAVMADEARAHPVVARVLRDQAAAGKPLVSLEPDQRLDLGRGAYLQFLPAGQQGVSVYLAYGNSGFLIAGGDQLEALSRTASIRGLGRANVVFLTQANAVSATGARWLASLQPISVVVPDEPGEPASQPSLDFTLAFDQERVLKVSELGTVEFSTDGVNLRGSAERGTTRLP